MCQPHTFTNVAFLLTRPDNFTVPFVFQSENILIIGLQGITVIGFHQLASTSHGIRPASFVHVEFHQKRMGKSGVHPSVVTAIGRIHWRQYLSSFFQFRFDVIYHPLLRRTGQNLFSQRIFKLFKRSHRHRSEPVIQQISHPAPSATQFRNQTGFLFRVHIHTFNPADSQSHFTDTVHIPIELCHTSGIRGKLRYQYTRPYRIIPITISQIGCHIPDNLDSSLTFRKNSGPIIRPKRRIRRRCDQSLRIFFRFREDGRIDYIIHFRIEVRTPHHRNEKQ